jgi:hypothetical protein
MVVEVNGAAASSRANPARALFPIPSALRIAQGQYAPGWDVGPDGRFLSTFLTADVPARSINVVAKWNPALAKKQ